MCRELTNIRTGRYHRSPASIRIGIKIGNQIILFENRSEVLVSDPEVESEFGTGLEGILNIEHHTVGVGLGHKSRGGRISRILPSSRLATPSPTNQLGTRRAPLGALTSR